MTAMGRRFSKQRLHDLRNKIPMHDLIENHLGLPNRISDNIFRFQCPQCESYHTGVKSQTNLARCFDCRRNYNTIDLVMTVKQVEFYDSAVFLENILFAHRLPQGGGVDASHTEKAVQIQQCKRRGGDPVELIDILSKSDVLRPDHRSQCPETPKSDVHYKLLRHQVASLESEIERLKRQIKAVHKLLALNMAAGIAPRRGII